MGSTASVEASVEALRKRVSLGVPDSEIMYQLVSERDSEMVHLG